MKLILDVPNGSARKVSAIDTRHVLLRLLGRRRRWRMGLHLSKRLDQIGHGVYIWDETLMVMVDDRIGVDCTLMIRVELVFEARG